MDLEIEKTSRGFKFGKFVDDYGHKCSLQKSSNASRSCIWLGVDDVEPQILSQDAIRLGLKQPTNDQDDWGWMKYELPKEVHLSTRMHLTQDMVKELLPALQKFAETGEL